MEVKATSSVEIPLTGDDFVNATIETAVPIQIFGHDENGKFPLGVINPRRGPQRLRNRFKGLSAITLHGATSKAPVRLSYRLSAGNATEPLDDREVPTPPRANSLLARMRQEFRQQLRITREHFINDEGLLGYEIDDEDPGFFEEELAKEAESQRQQQDPPAGREVRTPQNEPSSSSQQDPAPSEASATSGESD